jgi:hypothetical protein
MWAHVRKPIATLLALMLVWATNPVAFGSVLNAKVPGKWPGGRIVWYYNPAGQPADLGGDEVIAAVKAAFAEWQRVCRIEGEYAGLTTVPVDPIPATTYVVGWTDFGSPQFHAKGVRYAAGGSAGYAPLTGGGIQINTSATDLRALLDNGGFLGIMQHEVAHTFGLAHSDDPTSIMFANPYNTATYERTLQGDDIAACADLYGARGLAAKDDLRDAVMEGAFPVQVSVLATRPSSTPPTGSLGEIDPVGGGPYYFDRHWQGLAVGSGLEARWVTPNGSVYQRRTQTTTSSTGFRFSTFPDDGVVLPYLGQWAFQLLVNGRLAGSVPFRVARGTVSPIQPFEAAVIGEAVGGANVTWRVASHGNGALTRLTVVANGVVAAGATHRAAPGDNVVEAWAETDRPRYKLDQNDGQPATSFDVMRQVRFVAGVDGLPVAAALGVSETGTPDAYTAIATVAVTGSGQQGIYVAAVVGDRIYYRQASGWSFQPLPLVTVQAPAVVAVDLVRNVDTRDLPAGSALYAGYGRSLDEVIALRQYSLVRSF